jgi:hypothetical protein
MSHLDFLPDEISVTLKRDADGYIGRECPARGCRRYFKVTPGTGLTGKNLPCVCPYCGNKGSGREFFTREQIEYAKSVGFNMLTTALLEDLRELEFDHRPVGRFGFGLSMKVEGEPHPIEYYREKRLETEVVCNLCTLRYAIYGVFGYCPDCGAHNSLQILSKNLDLAEKEIALAATLDGDLKEHLIGDAIKNAVAAFDGFGREACRVKLPAPPSAKALSFQNLAGARTNVLDLFGFDFASGISVQEWALACQRFKKRHLLVHKMGVIDEKYVNEANDPCAVVGRKVRVTPEEVVELCSVLRKLGAALVSGLNPTH